MLKTAIDHDHITRGVFYIKVFTNLDVLEQTIKTTKISLGATLLSKRRSY